MKLSYFALPVVTAACLLTAGCASHTAYYAPPPPPPPAGYTSVPPLIARADQVGFRSGNEDGARDSYNGFGYHPQHDRKFHTTPGYDSALGPFEPYRDAFQRAYLRGYDQGFHRG
ncbi:hypothetical protein [Tunturiibacter gelidoferens]|uniref:Lipoprotein n=2 Tax=Tunturiibacter TaxID=3154218 RepID=A0A7Y9NM15_9BACT|nr:hypothetical protein [Edaphobacter lichenicola]MBB5338886.1 hypothetical protein [Edaphobacter lichenicola]NYF51864.1 hypothetical protein [Edaphobacter lichenicola]